MSTQELTVGELVETADRAWMAKGKCWGEGTRHSKTNPNPWFASNNETYGDDDEIKGSELVGWALIVCAGCDAQYDCARFAVRTSANYVTSAMRVGDLRWLQEQKNWERIVDIAEVVSVPIQQVVKLVRHPHRSDDLPRCLA